LLFVLVVWAMMFASTFHFGHLEFFGLRQALDRVRNTQIVEDNFTAKYLYLMVRHPISLGWMLTPWLTSHMTVGQIVYAISITAYVLMATRFEEQDLVSEFGDKYRQYQRRVPVFVLRIQPGRTTDFKGAQHEPQPARSLKPYQQCTSDDTLVKIARLRLRS